MEIIAFFAGVLFRYTCDGLILGCLCFALWTGASYRLILFFLCGCFWAFVHHAWVFQQENALSFKKTKHAVQGVVSSIPKTVAGKTQFEFDIATMDNQPFSGVIWMSCYRRCPKVGVGERWFFKSNITRPRIRGENPSFQNWLISNHIVGLGRFNERDSIKLHDAGLEWSIQKLREGLAKKLEKAIVDTSVLGIIQGVTLGLGQKITSSQWDLFRRTGTVHLVVISGEHISLIAGAAFLLFSLLWKKMNRVALSMPAQRFAAVMAWIVGYFYALIAGFGAPVERAIIGFGLVLSKYFLSSAMTCWQIWCYALLLVVLIEPHTVLTPGFYLSFIAVAVLFLTSARFQRSAVYLKVFQAQFFCLVGLLPLTLFFFGYGALNGLFINFITIPIVGWLIVPSALLALCLNCMIAWDGWFWVAQKATSFLLLILTYFDRTSWLNLEDMFIHKRAMVACMMSLALLFLMPIRRLYPIYFFILIVGLF